MSPADGRCAECRVVRFVCAWCDRCWECRPRGREHACQTYEEEDPMATRMLPVELSELELRERGNELAGKITALVQKEEEKKEAAKQAKEEIDRLKAEVVSLSHVVSSRKEPRPVEVVERPDPRRKVVTVVRLDTQEVVESRPMTPLELEDALQQRLDFEVLEGDGEIEGARKRGKKA
ncbi:MAG: hypothetical protein KIT58_00035 [Planctomycetota bacterium]|nr:hypothetical protein [Planctomycetota bacterium]